MKNNIELKQIEDCINLTMFLQGQKEALNGELETVKNNVEKAKKWLAKQPDYLKFLQHLQSALHQKNIGAFSELLTYFVKDVLKKEKDIIFELYTYHNLPALRIESVNDGQRENIYEGNGGSIANIVSTGLRLIALSRLPHRKFIVLDEPDCWLKPDHVPFFAKIIGEISEKLKIQTVIISHHDWNYFKDYGRVIKLENDGKNLEANIVHDANFENIDDKADYIKQIRLRQFMSHQDTVFELHPYLTCIIGENDIGKSVLATAIKAVSYNDSHDSYIKHFEEESQVLIELTKNRQILWQRFKTTNQENPQKVKYSLFENGSLISSEFNSNAVPQFIQKELNILTTEGIDVHIGNQKQPVFLLSSDTKPQDKAKILSLGKESLILQKMMENIKSKTKNNKQIVKEGEEKFNSLKKQLENLNNIEFLVEDAKKLKNKCLEILDVEEKIYQISNDLKTYKTSSDLALMNNVDYTNIKKDIVIKDTVELTEYTTKIEKEKTLSEIITINTILEEPLLRDVKDLENIIRKISLVYNASKIADIKLNIKEPTLKDGRDFEDLKNMINDLLSIQDEMEDLNTKKENLIQWEIKINHEIEKFMIENNNICPTCKQHITKEQLKGEHNDKT